MGRNNEDFQNQILFHGTKAELNPGDIVEARGSYIEGKHGGSVYSTAPEHRLAFATPNKREAMDYGHNVYHVEYHGNETPEDLPMAPSPRFISRQGFKVVKKIK